MSRRAKLPIVVNAISRLPWGAQSEAQRQFVFTHSRHLWPPSPEAVKRDAKAEAAARARQWLAAYLERVDPTPGQEPDTHLGDYIADLNVITKRFTLPIEHLSITEYHPLGRSGWLAVAKGYVPPLLAKGMAALASKLPVALGQMHNAELPPAGEIIGVSVKDELVELSARIPLAVKDVCAKLKHRIYPLLSVPYDATSGYPLDLALVDRPQDPGEFAKRGGTILAKFHFPREQPMSKLKKLHKLQKLQKEMQPYMPPPQLSASAEAVIAEQARIEGLRKAGVDPTLVKAFQERNNQQFGLELIKAARNNPRNVLGGPRYQL